MGQADAAVDGSQLQLAGRIALTQHHGAGPTIALAAALLGPGAGQVFPQDLKQGALRWYIAQRDGLPTPQETDRLGRWLDGHVHKAVEMDTTAS
jgi:hypothetical protein